MEYYRYHPGGAPDEMTISDRDQKLAFYGYHYAPIIPVGGTDTKKKSKEGSGTFNTVRLKKYLGLGSKRKRIAKNPTEVAPNIYAVDDVQLKRLVCGPSAVPNVYYAPPVPSFAPSRHPPSFQNTEPPPCWMYGSVAFRGGGGVVGGGGGVQGPGASSRTNMVPAYASVSARSVKTRGSRPVMYAWEPFTYTDVLPHPHPQQHPHAHMPASNNSPVDGTPRNCDDTCKGSKQRGKCTCGQRSRRLGSKYAPRTNILEYSSADDYSYPTSPEAHLTHNFIARYPPVEGLLNTRGPGTVRSRSMSPGHQRDHRIYSKDCYLADMGQLMTEKNRNMRRSILECDVNPYELMYKEGNRQGQSTNRRMTTMDFPSPKIYEDCYDSLSDNILERDNESRQSQHNVTRRVDPPRLAETQGPEFRLNGQRIRLFGTVKSTNGSVGPVLRKAPPPPPPTVQAPPVPTRPPPERPSRSKGSFVSYVSLDSGKEQQQPDVTRVRSPVSRPVREALEQEEGYSSRTGLVKPTSGIHKTTVGIGDYKKPAHISHSSDENVDESVTSGNDGNLLEHFNASSLNKIMPLQTLDLKNRLNLRINLRDVAAAVAALKPILKKNTLTSIGDLPSDDSDSNKTVQEDNSPGIETNVGKFYRKKHVHFTSSCDSASSENLVGDGCVEDEDEDDVFGSSKELSMNHTEELDRAVSESEDEVYDDCQVRRESPPVNMEPIYENRQSVMESSLPSKSASLDNVISGSEKTENVPILSSDSIEETCKRTSLRRSLSERQMNVDDKNASMQTLDKRNVPTRSNSIRSLPDANCSYDENSEESENSREKCKFTQLTSRSEQSMKATTKASWPTVNNRALSAVRNNMRSNVRPQVPPPPVPTKKNEVPAPVETISHLSLSRHSDWLTPSLRLPRPNVSPKVNSPLRPTRDPPSEDAKQCEDLYTDGTSTFNTSAETFLGIHTQDFENTISPESRSPSTFFGESKESDFSQENYEDEVIYEQIPEPLYEEVRDVGEYSYRRDETESPVYSRKSIFDGASKTEILNYLQDARERVVESLDPSQVADLMLDDQGEIKETLGVKRNRRTRVSHMSNVSDSSNSSEDSMRQAIAKLAKHHYGSSEIERNDSGVGSETSKPPRLRRSSQSSTNIEHLCCDCDQALDPSKEFDNGEFVDPLLCRKCARRRTERKEIITEIVETEMKYGKDLKIIKEEFNRPMAVAGLLTADQLANIFLNLEELIEVNEKFSEKLRDALDIASELDDEDFSTVNIGRLFLESSAMLHTFETYCVRQGSAAMLLSNLEKEKELLRIFLKVSQMENTLLRRLSLNSFLMVPVQRVTKYPLLVNRLHKVTPYHHQDREMLREAQMKIELHLEHINQQAKDISGMNLWRRISNISSPQRRSLLEPVIGNIKLRKKALEALGWNNEDVRFVMEGRLLYTQLTENVWNRKEKPLKFIPVHALLVTLGKPNSNYRPDLADREPLFPRDTGIREVSLLLIKEKNNRFSLLRDPFHLHLCVVSADSDSEDVFEVKEFTTKEVLFLKADDSKDSQEWLKQLRYHAKDLGYWRKRRNALANIMISGMARC